MESEGCLSFGGGWALSAFRGHVSPMRGLYCMSDCVEMDAYTSCVVFFFFIYIPHPAEYGVGEFLILCHCPDAGVPVGIDLARIRSARGE